MVGTTRSREQLSALVRLVRTGCFAVPVTMTLFIILVMSGIGGYSGGWLWAPAIAVPPMAAVGWWGWGQGRGQRVASAAVALCGLALGLWISQEAPMSHGRLRAAMNSIPVPANFEHTGDSPGGFSMCFDECPSYSRQWLVSGDEERVQDQIREFLEAEGFVLGEWRTGEGRLPTTAAEGHRGRLGVLVSIATHRAWRDGEALTLAPGQVAVTATLDTDSG